MFSLKKRDNQDASDVAARLYRAEKTKNEKTFNEQGSAASLTPSGCSGGAAEVFPRPAGLGLGLGRGPVGRSEVCMWCRYPVPHTATTFSPPPYSPRLPVCRHNAAGS